MSQYHTGLINFYFWQTTPWSYLRKAVVEERNLLCQSNLTKVGFAIQVGLGDMLISGFLYHKPKKTVLFLDDSFCCNFT